jgi:hypothetical protein
MMTILRIDTGASWEQVMYINMYGCDRYGYQLNGSDLLLAQGAHCNDPNAFGWIAAFVFVSICLVGRFVLPTVLIGIVIVSFEDASSTLAEQESSATSAIRAVEEAGTTIPEFFTSRRIELIQDAFCQIDLDNSGSVDALEMMPAFAYTALTTIGVRFSKEQEEVIYQLVDLDGNGTLGFGEFVHFFMITKEIQVALRRKELQKKTSSGSFGKSPKHRRPRQPAGTGSSLWARNLPKLDEVEDL